MASGNNHLRSGWGSLITGFFLSTFNLSTFFILLVMTLPQDLNGKISFIFWSCILYLAPFLLFSGIIHYALRKFARRNLIVFARMGEVIVMFFGCLVLVYFPDSLKTAAALFTVFLFGLEYACIYPAALGVGPDLFGRKYLAEICGSKILLVFSGLTAGCCGAILIYYNSLLFHQGSLQLPALLLFAASILSLILTMRAPAGVADDLKEKFSFRFFPDLASVHQLFKRRNSLLQITICECYLLASLVFIEGVLILFASNRLAPEGNLLMAYALIFTAPLSGLALGGFVSGFVGRNAFETGMVPVGATGLIIFSILAGIFPGQAHMYFGVQVFMSLLIFIFLAGFSAGMALPHLQAWQLYFVPIAHRALFCTVRYLLFGIAALVAGILLYLLTVNGLNSIALLICYGLVSLILTLALLWFEPQFLLRFLILLLTHSIYRVRVFEKGKIPVSGPALLVANHASFVDHLLLMHCTVRPIRFMMHESFYRYRWLYPIVKWARIIEVPQAKPKKLRQLFEKTHEILQNGEILCIFPEGSITNNGIMSSFRKGLSSMIPAGIEVPVIPIRIGMLWGSIFTNFYGKLKWRWPHDIPHPATVSIGTPVPADTPGYKFRLLLSEMAADTELMPSEQEHPIHTQFARLARKHPFRKVFHEYDGATWKEHRNFPLLVKALLLSREIRKLTPQECKYVGVMLPNTATTMVVLLAILMADKTPAILNFTASRAAVKAAMEKADLTCVFSSRRFLEKINFDPLPEMFMLEGLAGKISRSRQIIYTVFAILMPWRELMNIISPLSYNDLNRTLVVIYSSGSSGTPKGVRLSHHNINSDIYSLIRIVNWNPADRVIGNLPVFHSFGFLISFCLPISQNSKIALITNPLDAKMAAYALKRLQVTVMTAAPGFLQSYMRRCQPEDFKSLRLVITGAERLRQDISAKFKEMTGLTVVEGYGCTELSPVVAVNVADSILNLGKSIGKPSSVGTSMPGIATKIVDPETFELLPPFTDGLLLVKGANVMQGYLKDPEKTAEVMHDDWYITGDIAQMDPSGHITITGRMSRFSKIAGEMVPHELVEREINEIIHATECCIGVCHAEDTQKGEKLIVLYSCEDLKPEEIVNELRRRKLPNLWIPRPENFHKVDHIPVLGSGKLDIAGVNELCQKMTSRES